MNEATIIAAMDIEALARDGFVVAADFVSPAVAAALHAHALLLDARRALRPAGVGRGSGRVERAEVRGDRVAWLDQESPAAVERPLLAALGTLRERINAAFYLGLWDFEAHYAMYPPGAFYARHRDRFASDRTDGASRVVSFVVYLNENWRATDGGALRLYIDESRHRDVFPESGTIACFLSERFEHEVLPATRERLAVTGWFRTRSMGSGV